MIGAELYLGMLYRALPATVQSAIAFIAGARQYPGGGMQRGGSSLGIFSRRCWCCC